MTRLNFDLTSLPHDMKPSEARPSLEDHFSKTESKYIPLIKCVVEQIDYHILQAHITSIRQPSILCTINKDYYTWGGTVVVMEINFEDGLSWVIRLRRIVCPDEEYRTQDPLEVARLMDSEVATLIFLKQNMTVPVPNVIAHSSASDFPPRSRTTPWMIMEPISGLNLYRDLGVNLWNGGQCLPDREEVMKRYIADLAQHQVELRRHSLGKIGSLYQNDNGEFYIGPIAISGAGPFDTSKEFILSFYDAFRTLILKNGDPNSLATRERLFTVELWKRAATELIDEQTDNGPFALFHFDCHTDNTFVDLDGKITYIFDWEATMTVPIEMFARPSIEMFTIRSHIWQNHDSAAAVEFKWTRLHDLYDLALLALEEESDIEAEARPCARLSTLHKATFAPVLADIFIFMFKTRCDSSWGRQVFRLMDYGKVISYEKAFDEFCNVMDGKFDDADN